MHRNGQVIGIPGVTPESPGHRKTNGQDLLEGPATTAGYVAPPRSQPDRRHSVVTAAGASLPPRETCHTRHSPNGSPNRKIDWPPNCAESITAADTIFKLELVSVAARKRGCYDPVPFVEGGPMTTSKMPWLMAGFVCLSLFSACGPERPTASPVSGDVVTGAPDELNRELVPGLDLWSQERRPAPHWGSEAITPDYLSRAKRHREFIQGGVPLEYRSRKSPYPAATAVILDGGRLFKSHCATCHGSTGLGDGVARRDLTPPPAFLAFLIDRPRSVDEYLLWTISEGGVQFGTEMPAYKEMLAERQIWQIVNYMRAGFPDVEEAGQN